MMEAKGFKLRRQFEHGTVMLNLQKGAAGGVTLCET